VRRFAVPGLPASVHAKQADGGFVRDADQFIYILWRALVGLDVAADGRERRLNHRIGHDPDGRPVRATAEPPASRVKNAVWKAAAARSHTSASRPSRESNRW
jgi:hypothetical protein